MLDEWSARAPAPAAPQLGVEALECVGLHPAERQRAERRPDVPGDVAGITVARRLLDLGGRQPLVEREAGVARVRADRSASTSPRNLVRSFSASAAVEVVLVSVTRFPVIGSRPPSTRTRKPHR